MGISVNGSIGKMRGLTTIIFLSAAAAVVRASPCQNDEDVYFPDPEDCGRFYMCVDGSVVGHMSCPDGLLWNNELLTCDWPRNVECKPGCPEGWSSVGDSCYFLSREVVKKFSEAQEFCQNMGAKLVEINSAEEEEGSEEGEEEEEEEDKKVREDEEEEGEEEEEEDESSESDSSSQESDHVWQWLSGDAMEFTNWWGEGPDDNSMGNLRGGCIQLLRKGATSPSNLDTYYWARAATNAKCTNNDADNGVICEM